ncbi:predicted protein [Aspergillus nidulans FGSC A4]|uniref:Sld7 C-terminal domain-containing protein n=1 Tax=Emericella nidulans (strain FGSC A4 / ATCC 38163 / CBS 112.46 / NRRL 194 / M139) TaxID=227321 RepID=Q5AYT5_EMENI|nr:hypothetical protein [Aspergillus nidulans FGSC A4]EAA57885.1 predicted protein [Aspergillus nidulans FGSC A4]CBF70958.1 TPA: conserved hypothetical protein [Aspergillus nidulans FGSC A4]|eukprot:XP_664149.1 predicted protein [Aspergillus nidulans FGSC A4]
MNIWSGAIALADQSLLQAFVNPALIPFYARVGPNLELHTSNPETSRWLKHKLLANTLLEEDDEVALFQTIQCPVGFLLDLNGATRPRVSGPSTTDLLVYGILSTTTSYERPPTPPILSSPKKERAVSGATKQELRIYATPISESLATRAQVLPGRGDPEAITGREQHGQFLPNIHPLSPKRKRVENLFESVAQHHKRVRHKGGEAVSQLMAQSNSQPSVQLQNYRIKREPEESGLLILSKIAPHRSRSMSISSNQNQNRPLSRPNSSWGRASQLSSKGVTSAFGLSTETPTQRGSVSTPYSLSPESREPSSEKKKPAEIIISDNKNLIIRTILTCMRLYGFNRTARPASFKTLSHNDMVPPHIEGRDSHVPGDSMNLPASSTASEEDEFKAMYHATYRASTFALRKYLREPVVSDDGSRLAPPILEKGKAMICIDGFLKLFCEEDH